MKKIEIGKKKIGRDNPVFIVAELSSNHANDFKTIEKSLQAIAASGADAVKIQTYRPETMTLDSEKELFMANPEGPWAGTKLYELYKKAALPYEWHRKIFIIAREMGIECFSSPFDIEAVDMLEDMNSPAYKIASYEITDIPLIEYAAATGKPMIISSGVATIDDIRDAVKACHRVKNDKIVIMKCTSAYPAPYNEMNLNSIRDIYSQFDVIAGLSDHSMGINIPVAAVALGARVIEKHFILDKSLDTPDASFSLDPVEFSDMVKAIREVEISLGSGKYSLSATSVKARNYSRSLFVVKDVKAGELLTRDNIRSIRPAAGIHPKYLADMLGKKFKSNFEKGTPLSFDMIE
ncbi:MAG: pseudaminic acid synthase [Bacteroidota bacterium]